MTSRLRTVIPVWGIAVVAAVLIGVFARADYLAWMAIAMACLVMATFLIQLVAVQKEGLVDRMILSLGGGILILASATVVLAALLPFAF